MQLKKRVLMPRTQWGCSTDQYQLGSLPRLRYTSRTSILEQSRISWYAYPHGNSCWIVVLLCLLLCLAFGSQCSISLSLLLLLLFPACATSLEDMVRTCHIHCGSERWGICSETLFLLTHYHLELLCTSYTSSWRFIIPDVRIKE